MIIVTLLHTILYNINVTYNIVKNLEVRTV